MKNFLTISLWHRQMLGTQLSPWPTHSLFHSPNPSARLAKKFLTSCLDVTDQKLCDNFTWSKTNYKHTQYNSKIQLFSSFVCSIWLAGPQVTKRNGPNGNILLRRQQNLAITNPLLKRALQVRCYREIVSILHGRFLIARYHRYLTNTRWRNGI